MQLIWPSARRGRPRQRSIPDILSVAAEAMLADAKWQSITWRTGTKGKLKARFAAVRVRTAVAAEPAFYETLYPVLPQPTPNSSSQCVV